MSHVPRPASATPSTGPDRVAYLWDGLSTSMADNQPPEMPRPPVPEPPPTPPAPPPPPPPPQPTPPTA